MESALRSATKTPSFPQPPVAHQSSLLPLLPAQAPSPQHSFWPASRPAPRAKKAPNTKMALPGPSAPSKKRVVLTTQAKVEWTEMDSPYSVSPSPSCLPMPTSLLVTARKVPTACAVEVVGAEGSVDVGATDELRRLLRL